MLESGIFALASTTTNSNNNEKASTTTNWDEDKMPGGRVFTSTTTQQKTQRRRALNSAPATVATTTKTAATKSLKTAEVAATWRWGTAMQVLLLTGLLQLAPSEALNENLAALNRHQVRQFHAANLLDLTPGLESMLPAGATDPRERRSLANGRWGLRPGKRSAATVPNSSGDYDGGMGGTGVRLLAADRPGAGALYDLLPPQTVLMSSSESDEAVGAPIRPFDLRALLLGGAPATSRAGARQRALDDSAARLYTAVPSPSNIFDVLGSPLPL